MFIRGSALDGGLSTSHHHHSKHPQMLGIDSPQLKVSTLSNCVSWGRGCSKSLSLLEHEHKTWSVFFYFWKEWIQCSGRLQFLQTAQMHSFVLVEKADSNTVVKMTPIFPNRKQIFVWLLFRRVRFFSPSFVLFLICLPNIRMGKKGVWSDFEHSLVVGCRRGGLRISETSDLLGFSFSTISRVYR